MQSVATDTTPPQAGSNPSASAADHSDFDSMMRGGAGGGTDLERGMSTLQRVDPKLFSKIQKDGKSGDGNSLAEDELKAYREGGLTKSQAGQAVSGAQSLANENGGGRIKNDVRKDAKDALGEDVIKGGKTRAAEGFIKVAESFTTVGAVVKGVQDGLAGKNKPEDVLTASKPAVDKSDSRAMRDLQQADPEMARELAADAKKGDGNAMTEDLVRVREEEKAGLAPRTFSTADAGALASQVGDYGKGKVSQRADADFTAAYGDDATLYRGSTSASKGWNSFEDFASSINQGLVSPVTGSVSGAIDLARGDLKDAGENFKSAAIGTAEVASMVVAPELAPEMSIARLAMQGAQKAGDVYGGVSAIQTIAQSAKQKGEPA